MSKRRKEVPDNRARCCVGTCNFPTAILYYKYPICLRHWEDYCDNKFKYKKFRDLRLYLGLPPIKKPQGYENACNESLAIKINILIDIELNVPYVVEEEYALWGTNGPVESKFIDYPVVWDGNKNAGAELYIVVDNIKVVLVYANSGIKYASRWQIEETASALQDILNTYAAGTIHSGIANKFNKSKLWTVNDKCDEEIEALVNRTGI